MVSSGASVSSLAKFRGELDQPSQTCESSVPAERVLRTLKSAMLVGIGYYVGTRIGFALTPSGQPNSAFWPSNAILLAAFLLAPRPIWWTFLLAVFPAHMFAQLQAGVPVWTAFGWFVTNTMEALIGAFGITRLTHRRTVLDSVRGVLIFVVFGVLIAPLATSFLDAAAVVITGWGRGYWPLGTQRFWTNALAALTVVPTIVLVSSEGISWIRKASVARCCEAGLLAVGTVLVSILVFGFQPVSLASTPALLYVPLPLLLWAAVRFGLGGVSLSLLCVALISIWYTMHGREPFFPYASMSQNILSLHILFCIVVVPLMFLSAVLADARRSQESLRRMSGSLIEAQEQERQRIAHELHDDLGQELALVQIKLNDLLKESEGALQPGLTDLSNQLSSISTTAREISHGLYPSQLEYLGLASALKRLCDEIRNGKHLSIDLAMDTLPHPLPPSISLCLYRVAQEALHNIITHSQAKNVQVELRADAGRISLRIADNGVGFDFNRETAGLGLASMRQRVRSVDGWIKITSSPRGGTRVEASVPLHQSRSHESPGAA
ncbi:MAG TPA: MASE1 domain-containing protein [Terriglobales bacterium]|nr:MASE1 domain-containing protein [Terriglobales bacterium]